MSSCQLISFSHQSKTNHRFAILRYGINNSLFMRCHGYFSLLSFLVFAMSYSTVPQLRWHPRASWRWPPLKPWQQPSLLNTILNRVKCNRSRTNQSIWLSYKCVCGCIWPLLDNISFHVLIYREINSTNVVIIGVHAIRFYIIVATAAMSRHRMHGFSWYKHQALNHQLCLYSMKPFILHWQYSFRKIFYFTNTQIQNVFLFSWIL